MTQAELNREIAQATGESVGTIAEMGFSLVEPGHVEYDPEPTDMFAEYQPQYLDWDAVDAERRVPLVLERAA